MERRILFSALLGLLLSFLTIVIQAEPDSYSKPTSYSTTTVTKGSGGHEASYWTVGSGVAVLLTIIPLLLIPLIIIGLKLAERGGYTGHGDGHHQEQHGVLYHRRAFGGISKAFIGDLTKRVFKAIKEYE